MGFRRRFRFAIAVLVAQLLLLGISVGWCFHMGLILNNGEVCFVETIGHNHIFYYRLRPSVEKAGGKTEQ